MTIGRIDSGRNGMTCHFISMTNLFTDRSSKEDLFSVEMTCHYVYLDDISMGYFVGFVARKASK